MGGKNKQAQRTKNNARPSSSGRSAEMLASTIPHFATFQAGKDVNYTLPGFALVGIEDMDSSVDTNFQLVLRKMNKKDATTKLKALQEFSDLIKASDPEAVKAVLAFWPRIYNTLATDTEHRVREAVHDAHYEVVIKAKRNLAPFLKQLVGPWFTSQYDTYPPAASSATKAFDAAFPAAKSSDAILFCQEEILAYIYENLVSHTPQTLSNPKTTTPEDADAKYERVIISSLQGYSLYLTKINPDGIKKTTELNNRIIENHKFWKFAKHDITKIRTAWYGVIRSLCEKAPFLLENYKQNVCTSVFNNLDETEPSLLVLIWEAALLTTTTLENWWEHVNVDKFVLPKLWRVLKDGGHGNASIIYPNLLPLISNLTLHTNVSEFYGKFFENLRAGLKSKNVLSSRSELNAVLTAIMECLQYMILKHQQDVGLCEKLIKTQLYPLLEWCFIEKDSPHKNVFNHVGAMIQYWSRNCDNSVTINYTKYLEYFWKNLSSMFKGLFCNLEQNSTEEEIENFGMKNTEFLLCLRHSIKIKKQQRVKFSYETCKYSSTLPEDEISCYDLSEKYVNDLYALVYETCQSYINLINIKNTKRPLVYLKSIIQEFESEKFFYFLNEKVTGQTENNNLLDIYNNLIKKWLLSESLASEDVIDMVFLLFKYLPDDDKSTALRDLIALDKDRVRKGISYMLNEPYNQDKVVLQWLQMDEISKNFTDIVDEIIKDTASAESVLLLKKAFMETSLGILISHDCVMSVIRSFCKVLYSPETNLMTIDTCASLAAYISEMIYSDLLNLTYGDDLILAFFTFSCNNKLIDCEYISEDTLWEVRTSWQDAIQLISLTVDDNTLESLTRKLADIIEKSYLELDHYNCEHLVKAITCYARCIQKSKPFLVDKLFKIFFSRPFVLKWREQLLSIAINSEFIRGSLSTPYDPLNVTNAHLSDEDVIKYFLWSHLVTTVISSSIEDQDDGDESEEIVAFIKVLDNSEELLLVAVRDICLINILKIDYKNTKFYKFLNKEVAEMLTQLKQVFKLLDDELKMKMESTAINYLDEHKWIWAHVLYTIHSEFFEDNLSVTYESIYKKLTNNLAKMHLLQTFAKHLTYDNMFNDHITIVDSIIKLRCLITCDDIEVQIAEAYALCIKSKNDDLKQYFSNVDFTNWSYTQLVIEIIRFFSEIITKKPAHVHTKLWDLIMLSLWSWATRMNQIKSNYKSIEVMAFITAVSDLFISVNSHLNALRTSAPESDSIDEWDNLLAENVNIDMINVWSYLTDEYQVKNTNIPLLQVPLLRSYCKCILSINYKYIFKANSELIPNWSKILKRCCGTLLHKDPIMQIWSYYMLSIMIPGLIDVDSVSVEINTPHEKGLILEKFKPLLLQTHEIVQTMLLEFKLVENGCRVETFTDSFTYTFAYLLVWDLILMLCELSSTEVCYQYAVWLRKEDLLTNMLNNIFKLMPIEVLHDTESKIKHFQDYFTKKFDLSLEDETNSEKLEQMACWVYAATLSHLPACARQWWSGSDVKTSQLVERVTSTFVSPHLSLQELQYVATHENKFRNMTVKVHPSVREVIAIYTVDEAQMELVITLPLNYPLGSPDVHCNRQIGGTSHNQWLMQLRKCVLYQNGRICDGLSLWNNNLNKKFDGVQECYICLAILHPGTYQLPKLSCQTCRKKFHSACLYKWFSTSVKCTCPVCRNLF